MASRRTGPGREEVARPDTECLPDSEGHGRVSWWARIEIFKASDFLVKRADRGPRPRRGDCSHRPLYTGGETDGTTQSGMSPRAPGPSRRVV